MAPTTLHPHGADPWAVRTAPRNVNVGDLVSLWGNGTPRPVQDITREERTSWTGETYAAYTFMTAERDGITVHVHHGDEDSDSPIFVHPAGGHSIPVVTFQFNDDPVTYSFEIATDSRDPKFLASCALDYVSRVAWHDLGIDDISITEPTPMLGSRLHYASIESGRDSRVDWRSVGWVSFLLPNVGE